MKVLLYTEMEKKVRKSGLGKAIEHQKTALSNEGIEFTTDPNDDYDIMHINTWFLKSHKMAKKAKKKGKKVVYHAHSTEEDFKNGFIFSKQVSPIFKKWLIRCYSLGDVIVTPTPYSKMLLEKYGISKEIFAISNGIELDKFKRDEQLRKKFKERYHVQDNEKVIIGVGLYIERKGIVDFVELAKRLPEYRFIWFGYSPPQAATKEVREALNTKLDNLLFAGYVDQEYIIEAMNGCDLYLFPTFEETEGIPIIEACACKTPALIRDIPVFDGWLEDGINVYKAKNIDEFEDKIKKILNHQLPDLGEAAYKVAQERDIKIIGKKLHEVYDKVLLKNE
jgi:1,2-diacylglycerol-3-alpha-glucose alpha-1,2-glucosyltransferase